MLRALLRSNVPPCTPTRPMAHLVCSAAAVTLQAAMLDSWSLSDIQSDRIFKEIAQQQLGPLLQACLWQVHHPVTAGMMACLLG